MLGHYSIFSQEEGFINGQLLDAKTGEPIVFASIHLKNRDVGVISNIDGGFKIPMVYRSMGDILIISSMGYQTLELAISDIAIYKMNLFRLVPAVFELPEAIVQAKRKRIRELSAKQIVRNAIDAIPENYPFESFSTVGYYRDYQMDNGQYVNLNEAILEVFDQGFEAIDTATTRTRIYYYGQNKEFGRDTVSDKPYNYQQRSKIIDRAFLSAYGGNEFFILKVHDAIRNYQMNTFDFINSLQAGDVLNNHSFKRIADTNFDEKLLYVILFERYENGYVARGKIYISKNDFAINRLTYAIYDTTTSKESEKFFDDSSGSKLIFEVTTAYARNAENKMYLNYISFNNSFRLKQPPKFTLKLAELDVKRSRIILTFNNIVDASNARDYQNYKAFYNGQSVKLRLAGTMNNQVFLYPTLKSTRQVKIWEQLKDVALKDSLTEEHLTFEVSNIKDVAGNLINERTLKEYHQFREFFVQEVKPNTPMPTDSLFMDKRKPIFKDQPISRPENFGDYWMNTPLKTIDK